MIFTFKRATKKPTGDMLKSIQVSAESLAVFDAKLCGVGERPNATRNRAGEWLADILYLIPIHLGLERDSRFVPLKDGVYSPDRSLR